MMVVEFNSVKNFVKKNEKMKNCSENGKNCHGEAINFSRDIKFQTFYSHWKANSEHYNLVQVGFCDFEIC